MGKLNIENSADQVNANGGSQRIIKRKKIKKSQNVTNDNNTKTFTAFPNSKSIFEIFLTKDIPKKIALNKSYFSQKNDNQQKLNLELGPTFEDLLAIGMKFTQDEIFGIGSKLMQTLRYLNIHNKIYGGIFPKNIRFSKDLKQYYLIDMSRCQDIDLEKSSSMRYYEKGASEDFIEQSRLFGSQNLGQNLIPSQRDEIQNILNILYYFECLLHQKKYKKSEIISSPYLKELYFILKQFNYHQNIMIEPIITYFSKTAKSLVIDDSFFQRLQISKLNDLLEKHPEKSPAFEFIIKNLKDKQQLQNAKLQNLTMIDEDFEVISQDCNINII